MENGTETPTRSAQQNRRMTNDWFRSPTTDYLNVASLAYPRGAKATVADLDENNFQVDVLYYKNQGRSFFRNGRESEEWLVQLYVDTDDFQDATSDSTKFAALGIQSKALIDAIRPAMSSVHCPIPEHVTDQHRFFAPFEGLFFAQGRLLETLKHAGLGNVKEKQLRLFMSVVQLVLRKLNHTIRDLAGKRIVDFANLWTLFPPGSFAVTEIKGLPHVCQVLENPCEVVLPDPNAKRKEDKHLPVKFASYGFDGYNIGCYVDWWQFATFTGHSSIASLDYRPLKYEERHGDTAIAKKAIERGRKSLEYQSYHHCQYRGKCYMLISNDKSNKTEINGPVIVDCLQARRTTHSFLDFFLYTEHTISPVPAKRQEIYNAMRPLFLTTQTQRPSTEMQEKRRQFFGAHEEFLLLMKPALPAWSLEHNGWYWIDVSNLEPIQFEANPMNGLVGSHQKDFALLSIIIDRKLQLMSKEITDSKALNTSNRKPLLIVFSGPAGTGKTSMVKAIAKLHRRPLINISIPNAALPLDTMRHNFENVLANAAAWQAVVLFDDSNFMFGKNQREPFYDQGHASADHAMVLERFDGIMFMTKKDHHRLDPKVIKQAQVFIKFEAFSEKKRSKIWKSLLQPADPKDEVIPQVADDVIQELSKWQFNGHEIEHMFRNLQLVYGSSSEHVITPADLEALKNLTSCPEEEWSRPSSRSSSKERNTGAENVGAPVS